MSEETTQVNPAPETTPGGDQTPKNDETQEGSKDVQTLDAQRLHWKGKAEKSEVERQALQAKLDTLSPPPVQVEKKVEQSKDPANNDLLEFAVFNREYDKEDLTELDTIARAKGITLTAAADSRLFRGYVSEKKREADANGGMPTNAERSPSFDREEDFSKISPSQVGSMTTEQFEKYESWLKSQG